MFLSDMPVIVNIDVINNELFRFGVGYMYVLNKTLTMLDL